MFCLGSTGDRSLVELMTEHAPNGSIIHHVIVLDTQFSPRSQVESGFIDSPVFDNMLSHLNPWLVVISSMFYLHKNSRFCCPHPPIEQSSNMFKTPLLVDDNTGVPRFHCIFMYIPYILRLLHQHPILTSWAPRRRSWSCWRSGARMRRCPRICMWRCRNSWTPWRKSSWPRSWRNGEGMGPGREVPKVRNRHIMKTYDIIWYDIIWYMIWYKLI